MTPTVKKISNTIESTKGYKTKAGAAVYVLLVLFGGKIPFFAENKENIMIAVDVLVVSGLAHDLWNNKAKIGKWIKGIFKK